MDINTKRFFGSGQLLGTRNTFFASSFYYAFLIFIDSGKFGGNRTNRNSSSDTHLYYLMYRKKQHKLEFITTCVLDMFRRYLLVRYDLLILAFVYLTEQTVHFQLILQLPDYYCDGLAKNVKSGDGASQIHQIQ